MRLGRIAALLATAATASAQAAGTVAEIVSTVREAVAAHRSDSSLARWLHRFRPAERLDDRVIEELESAGAGPKAVAEMESIRDLSGALPAPSPPPVFPHGPAPSAAEQGRILDAARARALAYAASLPDFICMESVRRYELRGGGWALRDKLEVKLTYFGQKEKYDLVSRNGRAAGFSYRESGGAVTEGEFGTALLGIFVPDSETRFGWDHWTTLRGGEAHVFRFRIALDHSTYRIAVGTGNGRLQEVVTGQEGLVYVDAASGQVMRVVAASVSIPPDFPVRAASRVVDYGFVPISSRTYLLPVRAEARMEADLLRTRNVVEFHGYQKFEGQSTITFH